MMDTRIALIGIIVEDLSSTEKINGILHEYAEYIVGRMGIPYRSRNIAIISIIVDAPGEKISALSGKLGMIPGVNSKVQYTKA
jgi:putative iron-only hydrogenase system regulator